MKTIMKAPLTTAVLVVWGMNAALAGVYASVAGASIDTGPSDHTGIILSVGADFNKFIGIEAYTLIHSTDDSVEGVTVDMDEMYGANLIGYLPITDKLSPFVSVGYGRAEASVSYMGYEESIAGTGTSYGAGVRYKMNDAFSLKAEYREYLDDLEAISLSLTANF